MTACSSQLGGPSDALSVVIGAPARPAGDGDRSVGNRQRAVTVRAAVAGTSCLAVIERVPRDPAPGPRLGVGDLAQRLAETLCDGVCGPRVVCDVPLAHDAAQFGGSQEQGERILVMAGVRLERCGGRVDPVALLPRERDSDGGCRRDHAAPVPWAPSGARRLDLLDADECRALAAEVDLDEAFVIERAHDPARPRLFAGVVPDALAFGVAVQFGIVRVLIRRAGEGEPLAGQRAAPGIAGRHRGVFGDAVGELELALELVARVLLEAVAEAVLVLLLEHAVERSQVHECSFCWGRASGSAR